MSKNKTLRYCRIIAAVAMLWLAFTYITDIPFRYAFFILLLIVMETDLWAEMKKKLSFKKGVISVALFIGVSILVSKVFPAENTISDITPLSVIASVVLAPVCEELFFRKAINDGVNDVIGAIASSALFGIFHGREMFVPAAIAGLALYLIYKLTGSLKASIIAHMANNALAVMLHPETIEFFRNLIR